MAAWTRLSAGGRAVAVVLGAVGLSAMGYVALQLSQKLAAPPAPAAVLAADALQPAADPAPVQASPEVVTVAPVLPQAPTFDTWRLATDGAAVVSGRGEAGAMLAVLVDGLPVVETEVTSSGAFAALFTLAPNPKPSLMSLVMTLPDGTIVGSDQTVALAAIPGPEIAAPAVAAPEVAAAEIAAAETAAPEIAAAEIATAAVAPPPVAAAEPAALPGAAVAADQPAAILLSDDGAVVLQGVGQAAAEVALTIDTIAYSALGDVQLGGRGQAGAFVRIYLDNALIQTVLVPQTGQWLTTLNPTPPGIYTLRVDQIDDTGAVTSRFETPFKRETLAALAAVAGGADQSPSGAKAAAATAETLALPTEAEAGAKAAADLPVAAAEAVVATPAAPTDEALANADPAPIPPPVTITVQPGFTLWGIAEANFGDGVRYVQVFDANKEKIKDPDLIYPGQVFLLPADGG